VERGDLQQQVAVGEVAVVEGVQAPYLHDAFGDRSAGM
jgi:hypothetical protein